MVVIGGCDALPPNLGKCRPDGRTITRIAATNSINERAIKSIAILRGLFSGARFCEKSRVAFACGGCWYCEVACIASLLRPQLAQNRWPGTVGTPQRGQLRGRTCVMLRLATFPECGPL